MEKNIVVIGGGIIGLSTAYFLQKEGHQVTVVDKSNFSSGASYVNAGYITPSHFIPLASPGIMSKGLKWMLNPASPFYMKPRLNADFLKWVWAFKNSATKENVEKGIGPLKDINLLSRELYEAMKASGDFSFHYERKGLLMYYKTDKVGEKEWQVGQRGIEEGLQVEHLSGEALKAIEPHVRLDVKGAVYYHDDAHTTPTNFMSQMIHYLKANHVTILANETVTDLEVSNKTITKVKTNTRELTADNVVLAAGTWSPMLSKKLGLNLKVEAGKGYRINVERQTGISIPSVLCEAKVAVTPMEGFTRFAGTMEIGGINQNLNPVRVNAIAMAAENYFPDLKITAEEKGQAACGLRPLSPDGLPYIGKSKVCDNMIIATGHAMLGWSLGPATGKLVSEIIGNKKSSLDLSPFHPDRTF